MFVDALFAQVNGTVIFERKQYFTKIMAEMPFMSAAEIDRQRLAWGKQDGRASQWRLTINEQYSRYEGIAQTSESGWSWREEMFILTRDYALGRMQDQVETLGKRYWIEESAVKPKWKVVNEIKEVAGYLCMKAETFDSLKQHHVVAWFTDAIRTKAGPEGYWGLPGLILALEIGHGAVVIEATEVKLSNTSIPIAWARKPTRKKTKKISRLEHDALVRAYIKDAFEANRNPYWNLRY